MIGGVALESIYWYTLLVCAFLSIALVFIGDIIEVDGPIDPVLIVPWIAFASLIGYLGEKFTSVSSLIIFLVAAALSTIVIFLINFYVVLPMKDAESTLSSSEKTFEGQVADVVTTIPVHGMGEVQIKNVTGSINRPATFYSGQSEDAAQGSKVLIIEVKEHVCYVVPYNGGIKL
ncbi:MAG: hypothetical protein ACK5NA_06115 [Enterococcus sp.]